MYSPAKFVRLALKQSIFLISDWSKQVASRDDCWPPVGLHLHHPRHQDNDEQQQVRPDCKCCQFWWDEVPMTFPVNYDCDLVYHLRYDVTPLYGVRMAALDR